MKNRILSLFLAVLLLVSMISMASAEKSLNNFGKMVFYTDGQFFDVKAADWFASGVQSAVELGLMKGNTETTFNPKGNLTVAEALVIACRLHSIYNGNGMAFMQGSPWYQVYVDYAVANKIITAGQFDPKVNISREQFAYVMCGALPSSELNAINNVTTIPDVKSNSTFGGFVYRLYNAGVLTGGDKYGTFSPASNIQRSEVAAIVTRIADRSQRKFFTLEAKPIVATDIVLSGATTMYVDDVVMWTANVLPEGASATLTWDAGNPGVATVTQSGFIMSHKAGQCNITVTASNGVKKTVMMTVYNRPGTTSASSASSNSRVVPEPSGTISGRTDTVYVSRNGIIHSRPDCSHMKYFTEMTYSAAVAAGYRFCSKC